MTRAPLLERHRVPLTCRAGRVAPVDDRVLRAVGDNQVVTIVDAEFGWRAVVRCVDVEDGSVREFVAPVIAWALVRVRLAEGVDNEIDPVFVHRGRIEQLAEYRRLFSRERISCELVRGGDR